MEKDYKNILTDMFYDIHYGMYPFKDDTYYNKSKLAIEYFLEVGLELKDIVNIINNQERCDYIKQDIPEEYYTNTILKPNVFYYHTELRLNHDRPKFSINTMKETNCKYHIEMKVYYSEDDILNYFYNKFNIREELKNTVKDKGSIKYLLQKYESIKFVQPIDFVLTLIDITKNNTINISDILDIVKYETDTYELLKQITDETKYNNRNKIIWRQDL